MNRFPNNIRKEIGNMKMSEVKQIHCQKILNKMVELGKYSYGTIELCKVTMHALFEDAVDSSFLSKNLANGLKMKRLSIEEEEEAERRVLTVEEQILFKEYASGTYYYNAYCLALETGLRCGEIGALKWNSINLEEKYLEVTHTLLQDKKKGGFYFGKPKSKHSKRKIPLTNEAIAILQRQKEQMVKTKANSWNDNWDGLVFRTNNGNPVGASTFREMILRIVRNINFDRKLKCEETNEAFVEFEYMGMHTLRHSFATRCIEKGVSPKSLQKIMGHSTLAITMNLYVHVTEDFMIQEMEKMNAAV